MAPATSPSVPSLPPSVEEAYRRKCVHLKRRMADVEEANDAVRVRLARLKRQVEKQRLERAFLLEQLAKRTSTNVEDSDGSPSPPATPKDKPLRTKRGHRKSSIAEGSGAPGSTFISQNLDPMSPSSDVFNSQTQPTQSSTASRRGGRKSKAAKDAEDAASASGKADKGGDDDNEDKDATAAGGGGGVAVKRPANAFELYCQEMRPALAEKKKASKKKSADGEDGGDDVDMEDADNEDGGDGETSIDTELARGWKEMEQADKDEYEARAAEEQAKYKKAKEEARQQKQKEKEEDNDKESKEGEGEGEGEEAKGEAAAKDAKAAEEKESGDDKADKSDKKAADKEAKDGEDTEMADPDTVVAATSSKDD